LEQVFTPIPAGAIFTVKQYAWVRMIKPGQMVRVNLAGMQFGMVLFHAAVTDAVGHVVRQISEQPEVYLVKLLFSFKGVDEVEVPVDRVRAA
jgi:hypothetical protein